MASSVAIGCARADRGERVANYRPEGQAERGMGAIGAAARRRDARLVAPIGDARRGGTGWWWSLRRRRRRRRRPAFILAALAALREIETLSAQGLTTAIQSVHAAGLTVDPSGCREQGS